jgi:archaellum component FlaF (FlaF/FlaG flagellin family)
MNNRMFSLSVAALVMLMIALIIMPTAVNFFNDFHHLVQARTTSTY